MLVVAWMIISPILHANVKETVASCIQHRIWIQKMSFKFFNFERTIVVERQKSQPAGNFRSKVFQKKFVHKNNWKIRSKIIEIKFRNPTSIQTNQRTINSNSTSSLIQFHLLTLILLYSKSPKKLKKLNKSLLSNYYCTKFFRCDRTASYRSPYATYACGIWTLTDH